MSDFTAYAQSDADRLSTLGGANVTREMQRMVTGAHGFNHLVADQQIIFPINIEISAEAQIADMPSEGIPRIVQDVVYTRAETQKTSLL